MMECFYSYGGSRKHRYQPYKTLFLRKTKYQCLRCFNKITEWEYNNWQKMWEDRDKLLMARLKSNSRKIIL